MTCPAYTARPSAAKILLRGFTALKVCIPIRNSWRYFVSRCCFIILAVPVAPQKDIALTNDVDPLYSGFCPNINWRDCSRNTVIMIIKSSHVTARLPQMIRGFWSSNSELSAFGFLNDTFRRGKTRSKAKSLSAVDSPRQTKTS
jgi:hypothetical protein